MTKECWRPVVGFEGKYEVSDQARVRSLTRQIQQSNGRGVVYTKTVKGKLLKPGLASNGYYTVALGRGNSRTVHSLVAQAFLGPCPSGHEVRHKNDCRIQSWLSNLEYGTRSDNIYDAVRNGGWFSENRVAHMKSFGQRIRPYYQVKA